MRASDTLGQQASRTRARNVARGRKKANLLQKRKKPIRQDGLRWDHRASAARQILLSETNLLHRCCVGCIRKVSHILQYAPSFPSFAALPQRKIFRSRKSVINAEIVVFSNPPKHLRRCKVKPHGSLVPVSSTHRCAYTPGLSTSSSSTFLQDSQGVRENSSRGKFRA